MEATLQQIQVKLGSVMTQVWAAVVLSFHLLTEHNNTQITTWMLQQFLQANLSRSKLILISFKKILELPVLTQQQHLEIHFQLYPQWKSRKIKKTPLWMEDTHTVLMEINSIHQDCIDFSLKTADILNLCYFLFFMK